MEFFTESTEFYFADASQRLAIYVETDDGYIDRYWELLNEDPAAPADNSGSVITGDHLPNGQKR